MPEPIVFISHFRIKDQQLEKIRRMLDQVIEQIESQKPRTLAQVGFADPERMTLTFVHVFGDADSMDIHVEGSEQRSSAAYEFIEPRGWEIYGRPSNAVIEMMKREAAEAGVTLTVEPEVLGGFLRLAPH